MPSPLPSQVPSVPLPGGPYPSLPPLEFDFYEALRQVVAGKKVTRTAWPNTDWLEMQLGPSGKHLRIHIHKDDGDWHDLIVTDGDMLAIDWTILE